MKVYSIWPDGTRTEENLYRLRGLVRKTGRGTYERPLVMYLEELPNTSSVTEQVLICKEIIKNNILLSIPITPEVYESINNTYRAQAEREVRRKQLQDEIEELKNELENL